MRPGISTDCGSLDVRQRPGALSVTTRGLSICPALLTDINPTASYWVSLASDATVPGQEHVNYHRAHPSENAAQAIIHPRRLSRERQLEVCTQCHGNATRAKGPTLSYRPGQPLDDYYRTAISRHPEEDHVANQIKYLRQSKCFQKSELTCTTCHDPHRATDHAAVEKSCAQCHEPAGCREQARIPAAVRDNCTGCHMPGRVWMNVHFHTAEEQFLPPFRRYDHRIGVYPEARDSVVLAWHKTQSSPENRTEVARLTQSLTDYWLAEGGAREFVPVPSGDGCDSRSRGHQSFTGYPSATSRIGGI